MRAAFAIVYRFCSISTKGSSYYVLLISMFLMFLNRRLYRYHRIRLKNNANVIIIFMETCFFIGNFFMQVIGCRTLCIIHVVAYDIVLTPWYLRSISMMSWCILSLCSSRTFQNWKIVYLKSTKILLVVVRAPSSYQGTSQQPF